MMIRVQIVFPILLLVLLLLGCNGDDNGTDISSLENYEAFGEEGLEYHDDGVFSLVDCHLDNDNSLLIIGNNDIAPNPAVLKIDSNCDVDFLNEITPDSRNIFRHMDLLKTSDQNFLYSSQIMRNSSFDLDVRKFDSSGRFKWISTFGSPNVDENVISAAEISGGKFILLAEDISIDNLFSDSCFYIVTLDRNGDLISNQKITDSDNTHMSQIIYCEVDSTILVLGNYGFPGSGAFQSYLKVSKYSLNGELMSSNVLLDERAMTFDISNMKTLEDGNILVYTSSNGVNDINNPTVQVFKINTNLDVIWSYFYDDVSLNIAKDIQETTKGDLLILSNSATLRDDEFEVVLTSLNQELEINWIKSYGTSSCDQGGKLFIEDDGDLIVVGNSNHVNSRFSYFILKTDSNGFPK